MVASSPFSGYTVELKAVSYQVPSATKPGVVYTVTITDDGYACTCPDGQHRRRAGCWHISAIKAGIQPSKPRVRIQPIPPAAPSGNPAAFLYAD